MFVELNPAYLVATLFFLTSAGYIVASVITYNGNIETRTQRDYLATGAYLVTFSLFYGLMTIAGNETLFRVFWALGFIAGFVFFPGWILFLSSKAYPDSKPLRYTLLSIFFITILIAVLCVISNEARMVVTVYGNRFSYHGSVIFRVAFIHLTLLTVLLVYFQIKWWQKAEIKRYRREALGFIIFSLLAIPIGYIADFIIPTFTSQTVIPIGSISILAASIPTYASMRMNKTLSIEVRNVSGHIFKSVTLPILLLDHKNIVKLENDSAIEFFGRSVNGEHITNLIRIDGEIPEDSFFDESFLSETIAAKAQDTERMCEMLLTVEKDKFGDALCKVIVISDLTEILQTLEHANDANMAKSAFLSSISRKIRLQVSEIQDRAEAIKKENKLSRSVEKGFESIQSSCDTLLGITGDIVDYSRIEADKMELQPSAYNPVNLVNETVQNYRVRYEDRQVDFVLQIDEDIPQALRGDEQRIKQILDKLLSNAFKYTETGDITLSVFTEPGSNAINKTLVFSVRDTGIGMSKKQMTELFKDCSRLMQSSVAIDGTGLGLTIIRSLIDLMKGEIHVESEPDAGTFVLVRLPQELVKL